MTLRAIYRTSFGLLTDLYQLTMAYGYFKTGMHRQRACFHLFFRRAPFGGSYAIAAGLEDALDYLSALRFEDSDLAYLGGLNDARGASLFDASFLDLLRDFRFEGDVFAMPEGTLVFPHEPLLRVEAELLQAQLVETALLTILNFQTLIATKASRICYAARGAPVLEFGLRRAQGIGAGLAASRAALIGGCSATSNVLAGKLWDIPVKGTHAHSWVMSFDSELRSFEAYAEVMPDNCIFLVDTYDTLRGISRAIEVSLRLRERGHQPLGIRLDSGDLAALSIEARKMLDRAGLQQMKIVASSDLDEAQIEALLGRGAQIDIWGVGTRLATAYDEPALGGVYKLAAIDEGKGWQPRLKASDDPIKASIPLPLQVRRYGSGRWLGDVIYTTGQEPEAGSVGRGHDGTLHWPTPQGPFVDLLEPMLVAGKRQAAPDSVYQAQERCARHLEGLDSAQRRLHDPEHYPVVIERELSDLRQNLLNNLEAELR